MQTIDDIESTGYSNIGGQSTQGSVAADSVKEKSEQNNPEPSSEKPEGETTKESGALENPQDTEVEDLESGDSEDDEPSLEDPKQDQDKDQRKPKRLKGVEKRIKGLAQEKAAAKAEADYWREQAMRLQQAQTPAKEPEKVQAEHSLGDGEPNPDDFDSNAKYIKALHDWTNTQRDKQAAARAVAEEFQIKVKAHDGRVQEFKASAPDYDSAVLRFQQNYPSVVFNQQLVEMVIDSDMSAPLAYELFKNPELLIRLNTMDAASAGRQLGRIEADIERTQAEKKKAAQIKTTTSAPPPLQPLSNSGASAAVKKPLYEIEDTEEFLREWTAKNKKSRR